MAEVDQLLRYESATDVSCGSCQPRAKRPRQSLHEPPISRHQQMDDADADSALVDDRMEDDTAGQEDAELTEADDVPLETRPVEAVSDRARLACNMHYSMS